MKIGKIFSITVLAVILGLFLVSTANSTLVLQDIDLGGGSTADIHIVEFLSTTPQCQNILDKSAANSYTIFAVHGITSDASVFDPLANALFANNPTGGLVCKVLGIEMPGHGGSGLPTNMLFGELTHVNYANAILNTLTALAAQEVQPVAIMSHSNGGLNLQVAQQLLANAGSSFAQEFGIEKITFLASVPSAPVSWPDAQGIADFFTALEGCFSGPGMAFAPGCGVFDVEPDGDVDWDDVNTFDTIGTVYDCDPNTVPIGIFVPPPGCENPSTLGDRATLFAGFPAPPEPLNIVRSAFGVPPQVRPITSAGIFAGVGMATLNVISFEDDIVVGPPSVHQDLFNHLAGGPNGAFHIVEGVDVNHVYLFFNPADLLDNLALNDICLIPLQETAVIPTLNEWGLIAMAAILGIVGFMVIRRRKATA